MSARKPGEENVHLILEALEKVNSRLDSMNDTIQDNHAAIERLTTRNNMVEALVSGVHVSKDDVNEACGVGSGQMLKGDTLGQAKPEKKQIYTPEQKAQRKKDQAFGGKLFAVYSTFFIALHVLSFYDMLPVYDFEIKDWDFFVVTGDIMISRMHYPVIMSIAYVVIIFGIKAYMKDKEPFGLRKLLALWSLLIGLFSIFGSLRTVPAIIRVVQKNGLHYSMCSDSREDWLYTPAGFWTFLFILSKVPELIDTLFIVLRKQKLITLHWYHHITVLCFCWNSWSSGSVNGLFFSSMNLTVHAFMYIFYSLAALGYRPTAFAQYITVIQILQMLVGTAITFYVNADLWIFNPYQNFKLFSLEWNLDPNREPGTIGTVGPNTIESPYCMINHTNALAGLIMYSSYLYLFVVFFYYAYINPPKKTTKAKKTN